MPDPSFRSWMEIAYFASGVLLVAVACVGLAQLVLAKRAVGAAQRQLEVATQALTTARDDIRIRSEREAVTLAAQRCEHFAHILLPRHNKHVSEIHAAKIALQHWTLRDANFSWQSFEREKEARRWLEEAEKIPNVRSLIATILNEFEAFAIYFTSGAAAEKLAYPVVGTLFCYWVEVFSPHIALVRAAPSMSGIVSDPYPNIVMLYQAWSGRRKKSELEGDATRINRELSGLTIPDIRAIGAEGGA
jgi:hypothetical protein